MESDLRVIPECCYRISIYGFQCTDIFQYMDFNFSRFLQGDVLSLVGFGLSEVPVGITVQCDH